MHGFIRLSPVRSGCSISHSQCLDGALNTEHVSGTIQTAIRASANMGKGDDRLKDRSCQGTSVTRRSRSVPHLDAGIPQAVGKASLEPHIHGTLQPLHIQGANTGRDSTNVHISASTTCSNAPSSKLQTSMRPQPDQAHLQLPGDGNGPPSEQSVPSGNPVLDMLKVGVSGSVSGVAATAESGQSTVAHGPGISALPPLPSRLPLQASSDHYSDLDADAMQHKMLSASATSNTATWASHSSAVIRIDLTPATPAPRQSVDACIGILEWLVNGSGQGRQTLAQPYILTIPIQAALSNMSMPYQYALTALRLDLDTAPIQATSPPRLELPRSACHTV